VYVDNEYELRSWLRNLNLGYVSLDLIIVAFTHRSFKGMGHDVGDYERLEFVGDSVLDLINAEQLYKDEDLTEAEMTELRKGYVSNKQLAIIFDAIDIERFIRVANNLNLTPKVKAGFVEAFFGAIYFAKGYKACLNLWEFITEDFFTAHRQESPQSTSNIWPPQNSPIPLKNAKTTLQEFCQNQFFDTPIYKLIKKSGPDHEPMFTVRVTIKPGENKIDFENVFDEYAFKGRGIYTEGMGPKKKIAEMIAAEEMCDVIGLLYTST